KDRKKIYEHIAAQQGATMELVEQRRAKQIVKKLQPGNHYQKPDGSWVKK
ncbi:MAG: YdbL family protein, partial [Desulfobacteraceae bacterium]|nr:YdbL family protein [Desulfobacteraceae bacterium]